jgi:hypothetical protein
MDEKKHAALLLGFGGDEANEPENDGDAEADAAEEGITVAAREVMDAMKIGDAKAFAASLKRFVSIARAAPDDEDD